jgi:phosphatidylglycerol:prolipoprotein diacylglycerol transferase
VDVAIPALPAAHAIGRLGCFLGGCCYGRPFGGAWAVVYTDVLAPAAHPPIPRHPAPLYESLGLIALAFALALVPLRRVGAGHRGLAYLAAYGALRVGNEAFRGDAVRGAYLGGAVSTSQLVGAVVCVGALVALYVSARGRQRARS